MKKDESSAPLYEALEALASCGGARFHMPGHKGNPVFEEFGEVFAIDYTETYGTGNLYEGTEPIRSAELRAAALYGAADCHFLTGGSTQGIQAMLCAGVGEGGAVLLDRACHKSAASACALFDLHPAFIGPPPVEPFGFTGVIDPHEAARALDRHPACRALLVVSPNYYGVRQDLPALARVCHARGRILLVDAAHGAHFPALGLPSPLEEGADAAVLSAHKTLPCLGQAACLLFGPALDGGALRRAEAMVGTSSPSYPILCTLDLARAWMEGTGGRLYRRTAQVAERLRRRVNETVPRTAVTEMDGLRLDPCRLTLYAPPLGMTGHDLAALLHSRYHIDCEMADHNCTVLILTGADQPDDLLRLARALRLICRDAARPLPEVPALTPPPCVRVCSVRQAWFAPAEGVLLPQAAGRVCAGCVTPYPPGIPLLWPGEKITGAHVEFLRRRWYTDSEKIRVII